MHPYLPSPANSLNKNVDEAVRTNFQSVPGSLLPEVAQSNTYPLYGRYFDFTEEDWKYVPRSRADLTQKGVPEKEQVLSLRPFNNPGKYGLQSHGIHEREYYGLGAYVFEAAHRVVTYQEKQDKAPRLIGSPSGHYKVAPYVTLSVELPLRQMQAWAKHIGRSCVSELEKELEYHFTKSEDDEVVWNCRMVHPASRTAMDVRPRPGEEVAHGTHGVASAQRR